MGARRGNCISARRSGDVVRGRTLAKAIPPGHVFLAAQPICCSYADEMIWLCACEEGSVKPFQQICLGTELQHSQSWSWTSQAVDLDSLLSSLCAQSWFTKVVLKDPRISEQRSFIPPNKTANSSVGMKQWRFIQCVISALVFGHSCAGITFLSCWVELILESWGPVFW